MRINLVVAMATNRVIGRDGALPWHLPADLGRFREITLGHPIIMGRVTHRSIGRVLPGRLNIVVTGDPTAVLPGGVAVTGFDAALAAAAPAPEVMVIGGDALYRAAFPRAHRIYLTEVHAELAGDVTFPMFALDSWREIAREDHPADARHAYPYSFVVLERRT